VEHRILVAELGCAERFSVQILHHIFFLQGTGTHHQSILGEQIYQESDP
tara:strand:- start:307 stop:453 length:147 start_codon:yes stop_codon:yes gene_type:complete